MTLRISLLVLLFASLTPAAAQQPRFQQQVHYRIEARLEEGSDVLHGRARMSYGNRSTQALDTLYFHQHLNAFRPNSAWARREMAFGVTRFQELGPDAHGFERFVSLTVDGQPVRVTYPFAPDSTVAAVALPRPLAPGADAVVDMEWEARLATIPRRQGRSGRHFDWAHWYPRIAVYDRTGWAHHPLLPQGEFYGEFADYDVTLDLPADQVVGSTGVPVEGDPGYTVDASERSSYPATAATPLGLLSEAAPGRKQVRWRADRVIHFAWSADPAYRHEGVTRFSLDEGGSRTELPSIHVFFLPGDTAWDERAAATRTLEALTWIQGRFGPYPYPQLTNLHRLEGGGTEFPMMVMNGNAGRGLIVHEVTHQWLHGVLANNEWRQGWLDEGFTSFITNWYAEAHGDTAAWLGTMRTLERLERADSTAVIDQPGEAFASPRMYTAMTYTKTSAVFRMLRDLIGEQAFDAALRRYYDEHRLSHVTGADFQAAAEAASSRDLDWFFGQWFHRTDRLDYGIASASTTQRADGRWQTRVEVLRLGSAWMPVTLAASGVERRLDGRDRRQVVTLITAHRPAEVVLDPEWILIDPDRSNNRVALP